MDRVAMLLVVVMVLAGVAAGQVAPAGGGEATDEPEVVGFSHEAVDEGISRGVAYLWKRQLADGSWGEYKAKSGVPYPVGITALAAYALLESGVRVDDARMVKALSFLARSRTDRTYSLAMWCQVWLAASRGDNRYLAFLRRDVERLVKSTRDGSYGYQSGGRGRGKGDNSNSQFALLGVWAGSRAGVDIPKTYWKKVTGHWMRTQQHDGRWPYHEKRGASASMTSAGVASLYVCFDNLLAAGGGFVKCRPDKDSVAVRAAIDKGLKWFDDNFRDSLGKVGGMYFFYYLYCVERVALASGRKHFGKTDWYKAGAAKVLKLRKAHGAWDDTVNTAFAVLFLIRGRGAVLINKLQFDGDWNNRPRDLAVLTRWLSARFERALNWQVVDVSRPVRDWHDAPIMYISGAKAPRFSDGDLARLRRYVYQGGTLLSVAECGGVAFTTAMRQVYAKLFPGYKLTPISRAHPLYNSHFKMSGAPKLQVVSNGVRVLAIHTDSDLSLHWQLGRSRTAPWAFQIMANVFTRVTDSGRLRRRGTSPWPRKGIIEPTETIKLIKLSYEGNSDPEPLAWERFGLLMRRGSGIDVDMGPAVKIADLRADTPCLAVLTGTGPVRMTPGDRKALKAFLAAGGTLLIDAAGGDVDAARPTGFITSIEAILAEMYTKQRIKPLPEGADVFHLEGMEVGSPSWRSGTRLRLKGARSHTFRAVFIGARPAVLLTRYDITAALVGYNGAGIEGYEPVAAARPGMVYKLVRNILLQAGRAAKGGAAGK